jgi:short-subunit dehydrogenase
MTSTQNRPLAVVTGASSGIGLELAKQFAGNGYDLLLTADEPLDTAVAEIGADGALIETVQADLSDPQGVEQLAAAIAGAGRPVDALALNAGIAQGGAFVETPWEGGDRDVIAVDVLSTVHLAKRVVPAMVERGSGRILFTSSIAATMPGPYYATYAASKSFVQSFAEALRYELKDKGVTVTALMPGPTDTKFFERADMEGTTVDESHKDDPAKVAKDGFEAMMAGKDHVVAGAFLNNLQVTSAKVLPDTTKAAMHAKLTT